MQKRLKIVHQNNSGTPIVSVLDFSKLNEEQKRISVSMFSLNKLNSSNFIFSVEDVFHSVMNRGFLKKDVFGSTEFLAAHSIPFKILFN
jgi:hypothetical protein